MHLLLQPGLLLKPVLLVLLGMLSADWICGLAAQENQAKNLQHKTEIVQVPLLDGETLTGKLYLPGKKPIQHLFIFVHGSGPGTYLNRRQAGKLQFNYFDLFGQEFNERGIAFFSYNRRGVQLGDDPPWFDKVDREKFKKAIPSVETQDLATTIAFLKKKKQCSQAKIVLFGWSEGTITASLVAEKMLTENREPEISALFLAGYAHENMFDIIKWQHQGASSMLALNPVFDKDGDGKIDLGEYESKEAAVMAFRKSNRLPAQLKYIDADKDGFLTAGDFKIITKPRYAQLMNRFSAGDGDWIWKNYFRVSPEWLSDHFRLEPNKTRLLRLDLPVYIFHGTEDANVDVEGVRDLESRFKVSGKTNLKTFVFQKHNHDLNFMNWIRKKELPEGIQKIFEIASQLNE